MDSFELNKIIGALLGVVFIIFSVSLISESIFHTPAPETPGYAIAVPEGGAAQEGAGEEEVESVLPLLANADPSAGESIFKRCQACHTAEQGGPNKVGPNLWGVVNRPIASHEGFSYSSAMQEFSQGGELVWDYEHLDHFLTDPREYISGTAMSFAGLSNVEDRANVIAYLRSLSDDPAPLPEPAAAEGESGGEGDAAAGETAAPAEGEAAGEPVSGGDEEATPAETEAPANTEEASPAETEEAAPDAAPAQAEDSAPAEDAAPAETEDAAPAEEETGDNAAAPDDTATQPDAEDGEADAPAEERLVPAQ